MTTKILLLISITFISLESKAQNQTDIMIEQTIYDFLEGTNKKDIDRIQSSLLDNAVIFLVRENMKTLKLEPSFFIGRIRAGQSGGDLDRKIEINSVQKMGALAASVDAEALSGDKKTKYNHIFSLVNESGQWYIASFLIEITQTK